MFIQAISRAAQIRGAEPATLCEGRVRTWSQSKDRTARLAQALRALGVAPGDRIGVLALNSDRYLEAIHATWWCGAVTVPMNTRWAVAEHVYSVDDAGISVIFVDDAFLETALQIRAQRPKLTALIHMDADISGDLLGYEALLEGSAPCDAVWRPHDEVSGIFYTGGTTGHPKGVMHSSLSLWAGAACLAMGVRAPAHPRYLHAAPMFHLGDLSNAFGVTAAAGAHVFLPTFTPTGASDAIREHGVQMTLMVPTMIGMIMDAPGFDSGDFASLEVLTFGGSPTSDTQLGRMRAAFPKTRLVQGFGQTETMACGTLLHDDGASLEVEDIRRRSVGQALYGAQVGIFDEAGERVPIGTTGEIWINSPSAMLGYWKKPDQTAAALTDGWVHTGDAGYLDAEGYLFVCDRVKDMIISGGENVFSAEVENALASHPAVAQVAVIGVPDDRWGERVHAVIVPRPGASLDLGDLQAHCRARIAGYKIPRSFEAHAEPLPMSAVGKVMKTVLREPHWAGRARNVN